MGKTELRDILVVLPGIGGSVLTASDGMALWAPTLAAGFRFLLRPGSALERLRLDGDDRVRDELDDGVRATGLVPDLHLIPGLWKIDGYTGIAAMMAEAFRVEKGSVHPDDQRVANYFEFPYDWRRDNRVAARQLQRFVEDRLHRWRTKTPFKDAKVVIVAHSMGGLVARYFLEVLGGHTLCKALVTIGTPHRGAVKAVDFLAGNKRLLFADLTSVLRSFTSVYQLLPRYPVVEENGRYCRVTETTSDMPGIDRRRAQDGLAFHHEIEAAVAARTERGYELIPVVGTWQPTLQSVTLASGRVTVAESTPTWTAFPEGEGDGTVPRVSAVPVEYSDAWLNTFVSERHASIQNHAGFLQDLQDRLIQSQVRTGHIRGSVVAARAPALSLRVEDVYASGTAIALQATVKNIDPSDVELVRMQVTNAATNVVVHNGPCAAADGAWTAVVPPLPPDVYRVVVTAVSGVPAAIDPVHDVFVVVEA
jgi:pimeloyl-ACP methyl ester carboxylesterase